MEEITTIEGKINNMMSEASHFIAIHNGIEAVTILMEALKLMEKTSVRWQMKTTLYQMLGDAQYQAGTYDDAIVSYIQAYECNEDDNGKAAAANIVASQCLNKGDESQAFIYADKALETATAPEIKSQSYQIKGGITAQHGNYQDGIKLMNRAAELAEEVHSYSELAMIIMDMAGIFMTMGRPETALSEIFRAERYAKETRNMNLYMRCAIRKAKILYKMGKDDEAKALILALDEQKS